MDLTPEQEEEFFRTGVLPENLNVNLLSNDEPTPLPAPEPEPEPAPAVEARAEPVPQPAASESALERMLSQRLAELDAKIEQLSKPKPAPEEEIPDPTTDPLGHIVSQLARNQKEVADLKAALAEERSKSEMKREYESFVTNVRAMRDEFAKATPDFEAAYTHIRNLRIQDLVDTGMTKTQAAAQINQDEVRLAAAAVEQGKNPAEMMYNMAKRYGFVSKADVAADKQKAAETKVERLANGQFASKPAARSAPQADLTLEGLKDASNSDLNQVVLDDKMWKQIVGGQPGGDIFHH